MAISINTSELWEILVPYKIGRKIVYIDHHRAWDSKVREIAGGLTISRVNTGQWVSPSGKLHKELMIPVKIACTKDQIQEIMAFTKEHYKQEAVFAYLISSTCLVLGEKDDKAGDI